MDYYFNSIVGYHKSNRLIIKGAYSIADIVFVLDTIGYSNYSIEEPNLAGNTIVTLRNQL